MFPNGRALAGFSSRAAAAVVAAVLSVGVRYAATAAVAAAVAATAEAELSVGVRGLLPEAWHEPPPGRRRVGGWVGGVAW